MFLSYLKCKIHRATITDTNLNYEGSIEIDEDLMKAAGLLKYEQVQVLNLSNASRFVTYAIPAPAGSGRIALAGPAARLGSVGDMVVIISYAMVEEKELASFAPTVVHVNAQNAITRVVH